MGDARTDSSNDSQTRTAASEIAKFSELVAETVSSKIKREDFANCDCEIIVAEKAGTVYWHDGLAPKCSARPLVL